MGFTLGENVLPSVLISSGVAQAVAELDAHQGAAGTLIQLHGIHAVKAEALKLLIFSPDTRVLVIMLHHSPSLQHFGLSELWIRVGTDESIRHIPVHTLAAKLGSKMCEVILANHALP